jgi:hypothetical protein
MVTIHDIEQGTPEWHALREGKYTGSSADRLLLYGAIDYSLTQASGFGGSFATRRGHLLEDEAIELYDVIHDVTTDRPGFVTNSKFPTCGYSPDGFDGDTLLEVKCFKDDKHMEIVGGNVPFKVLAQIHFGLLITEKKRARLIAYNPRLDAESALWIIDIKRNPAIARNFREKIHAGR